MSTFPLLGKQPPSPVGITKSHRSTSRPLKITVSRNFIIVGGKRGSLTRGGEGTLRQDNSSILDKFTPGSTQRMNDSVREYADVDIRDKIHDEGSPVAKYSSRFEFSNPKYSSMIDDSFENNPNHLNISIEASPVNQKKFKKMKQVYNSLVASNRDHNKSRKAEMIAEVLNNKVLLYAYDLTLQNIPKRSFAKRKNTCCIPI